MPAKLTAAWDSAREMLQYAVLSNNERRLDLIGKAQNLLKEDKIKAVRKSQSIYTLYVY